MSLYIQFTPTKGSTRMLRAQSLVVEIGEDSHGIISSSNLQRRYFVIFSQAQSYRIFFLEAARLSDGTELAPGKSLPLTKELQLHCMDCSFILFPVSSANEILARGANIQIEDALGSHSSLDLPTITIFFAGASRSYPLFPNLSLSMGPGEQDPIQIDFAGLKPKHAAATFANDEIRITAEHGSIRDELGNAQTEINFASDGFFTLDPVGLKVQVQLPKIG